MLAAAVFVGLVLGDLIGKAKPSGDNSVKKILTSNPLGGN
jgi:hypothetical protein